MGSSAPPGRICRFRRRVVFRGALLPALLRRYGFHRGIFFTGLVWAAIHFRADSYSGLSVAGVFYHLLYRILVCLVWNYVFSWMALRWKSVLPSTATHGVSNMLAYSGIGSDFAGSAEVHLALWALLAWVLFRYRPLRQEADLVNASIRSTVKCCQPMIANPKQQAFGEFPGVGALQRTKSCYPQRQG